MTVEIAYKDGVYVSPELLADPEALFHLNRIQQAALRTAPESMVGDVVMVTSISRPASSDIPFSYHHIGRAMDFRTGLDSPHPDHPSAEQLIWSPRVGAISGEDAELVYWQAMRWAAKLRLTLGDGYDVVYGIERKHWNHIHVERDRRDG